MILASLSGGGPDGTLVVVSEDRARFLLPEDGPRTLQAALDQWDTCRGHLDATYRQLESPDVGMSTAGARFASPLPRALHWAEGSCYLAHMERIRGSRGEALPLDHRSLPKVVQTGGAQNLKPVSEFTLPDPDWELDIEGTIVVITGAIAAGSSAGEAISQIRLVGLTNDLTYRYHIVKERREGSGMYHSKPGRAYAPYVVTPDTLAELWNGAELHARVRTEINGVLLGEPWSDQDLAFNFGRILEHLCLTRALAPGSIVGTGTVANADPGDGIGCLAEQRAVEQSRSGAPETPYLQAGDTVAIEAVSETGVSLFGRIEQIVVAPADR
jgi:fumarylacetoacetate (FAA) hydrolase